MLSHKEIIRCLPNFPVSLLLISVLVLGVHSYTEPELVRFLVPENVYKYTLSMSFDTDGDVSVSSYLPSNNGRIDILDETIISRYLDIEYHDGKGGRYAQWTGSSLSEAISYRALLSLKSIDFDISDALRIPKVYESDLSVYLMETEAVAVKHEEIISLWKQIAPVDPMSTYRVLRAIYEYTDQSIKTLPFKGFTDSLTALRLSAASCNGKSRLFASLARLNNLPIRLVGGVILNGEKKKTSHQWVEVYIENNWVPFDPTNGYFSRLPKNYVGLYRGDHQMFKHTQNISFDYAYNSTNVKIAPALYRDVSSVSGSLPNVAELLKKLGLPIQTSYIFLLFPFCTLLITFLRNIIGIKTFGVFMPMLIAAASVYTGFLVGILGFSLILLLAYVSHVILGKFNILKIPRLSAIITITTIATLMTLFSLDHSDNIELSLLALFPVVIISFAADRIHQMTNESNWSELLSSGAGTLVTMLLCYAAFNSFLLQGLFSLYPELLITVLALQLLIGSWSGMRISEVIRFRHLIRQQESRVLSINGRNRGLIYEHNTQALLRLAMDKIATKKCLRKAKVPCPLTLASCHSFTELGEFMRFVSTQSNFVIKPNRGARGQGIVLFTEKNKGCFVSASGESWPMSLVQQHVEEIMSGAFSQNGDEDDAFIEPMIRQHAVFKTIAPIGLCDIRLILCNGRLISAMLRVPTLKSNGKANIHQGAIGVSIDLDSGLTGRCLLDGKVIHVHPDSGESLEGEGMPYWDEIKDIAIQCYVSIPLGYMGVDICLDEQSGPLVLEINGRPGLEIQNVNETGLHDLAFGAF